MRPKIARYHFSLILTHWVLILMSFVLLGLGWYIQNLPPETPARNSLLDLHISLGLTSAILLAIQILLRLAFKPAAFPIEFPRWQKLLAYFLYLVIYFSFTLMLISGYLQAVFGGTPLQFWGAPLPVWGTADATLAGYLGATHRILAFVLGGSIFVHVCIVALNIFKQPGIAAPMLAAGAQESLGETQSLIASKIAQRLAKNLRVFGWIGFWLQLVLGFVSALLLAFANTGRASSVGLVGIGDAIDWGGYALLLSCFAVLLAFYYTRAARKVVSRPDTYFGQKNRSAFWFLGTGILAGLLGVFTSFTGVALSISLLISKTVSIPPGIMLMDPTQIIRAIDVFALMLNFILLVAHFIGTGISLLLRISVSKARHEYMELQ